MSDWYSNPYATPETGDIPRFNPIKFRNVPLTTQPRCLIKDLIPRDSLVLVWGPPKCGKSFWVFDLVMHIALGWEYRGRPVEQGSVIYIAAEGEVGIRARLHAFRHRHLPENADPPFWLLTTRLDLVEDIDRLITELAAVLSDGCVVLVIDTLNRPIRGSESKDDDMGAYRDAADRLREHFHCAVIIIHHCGVDGSRPRGHTSLSCAADAQLAVKKDVDGSILVTLELMKDGPEGAMMRGRLDVVEVGTNDSGEPITSCVVEHLDAPASTGRPGKQRKLSPSQVIALRMLGAAVAAAGQVPPTDNHVPFNVECVPYDLWRRYCYEGGIAESDDASAKRKAFSRAAEALIAEGRVGKWSDWVWPATQTTHTAT